MLSRTGDISLRRRVFTIFEYLDLEGVERVLDVGCGEGFYIALITELSNAFVYGLDIDGISLQEAKKRLHEVNKVAFVEAESSMIPFPSDYFDAVILTEVLEHVTNEEATLREVCRVLRKGGLLALTVPHTNYPLLWDPINKVREWFGLGHFDPSHGFLGGIWAQHLRLYKPRMLRILVEKANFKVFDIHGITQFCLPFNHNILYFFKKIQNSFAKKGIAYSTDKFGWKEPIKNSLVKSLFNSVFWLDRRNDRNSSLKCRAQGIALLATKT